jgi:DNA-binding GntR family transcriptional regulator
MQPLDLQPALIDRAYEQLVEAIADGTLAPGQRIRQEELGRALGVSRQPISHALQLLKQQKLVEESGRRGLIDGHIDDTRERRLPNFPRQAPVRRLRDKQGPEKRHREPCPPMIRRRSVSVRLGDKLRT